MPRNASFDCARLGQLTLAAPQQTCRSPAGGRARLLPLAGRWVNISPIDPARTFPPSEVPPMRRVLICCLAVGRLCRNVFVCAAAQEWTRFRGPNGTGESETTHDSRQLDRQGPELEDRAAGHRP